MVAAGDKLTAALLSAQAASGIQTDSGTVAQNTYTGTRAGTTNVAGCAFTAPESGKISVQWAAGGSVSAAGFMLISFEIRTGATVGSGTVVWPASDNIQIQYTATSETSGSTFYPVTGLTPGADYNIRLMYRTITSSVTGTINRPRVAVSPMLA